MIDITREELDTILSVLPTELRKRAVVAGGYAADPLRAGDIDIWICAGSEEEKVRITDTLWAIYPAVTRFVTNPQDTGYLDRIVRLESGYKGKAIEIMVSTVEHPQELVDSFDISCHAVAVGQTTPYGIVIYYGRSWTPPVRGKQVRVLRFTTPESTRARLEKVVERYGVRPHPEDLTKLAA